ncbi:MAG: hypothetical protein AB8B53_12810 [Flavobacteriales bacterium]
MKRSLLLFLMVCSFSITQACDICSASSRIRPNDFKHTIGLHYNQRLLSGEIPSGLKHLGHLNGLYSTDLLEESFNTIELRARYRLSNRLALFGIMPYKANVRTQNGDVRELSSGIGDPIGFVEYRPFLPKSENTIKFMTNLRAGVKFPLGNTTARYQNELLDYDFQPGSGSYDFLLGSESYIGTENLGLVLSQLYKRNTANLSEFKFGDSYMALAMVAYRWNKDQFSFSISSGIQHEKQWMDEEGEKIYEGTERTINSAVLRADFTFGNIEVYGMYAAPVNQRIESLIILPSKHSVQVGLNYLLKTK